MKILHLTFHRSPQYDLEYVCRKLNHDLETLYFHDYASNIYKPNRYKVTEERAEAWWRDKKDYYQSFDLIIASDTAALSRIFLQHIDEDLLRLAEWYCDEHRDLITYFDNWDDLVAKAQTADWPEVRKKASRLAQKHHDRTLDMWRAALAAE